jgi:hypothetical protein
MTNTPDSYFSVNSNFRFTLKYVFLFKADKKIFVTQNKPNTAQQHLICDRTIHVLEARYVCSIIDEVHMTYQPDHYGKVLTYELDDNGQVQSRICCNIEEFAPLNWGQFNRGFAVILNTMLRDKQLLKPEFMTLSKK